MRIFFISKYPTATTIYKVLKWLVRSCSKKEFLFYVEEVFKKEVTTDED